MPSSTEPCHPEPCLAEPGPTLASLAQALGHAFQDTSCLHAALTHRSYANEHSQQQTADNERLEFLGDAVLGLVISDMLCRTFPNASEGELTRRRADLVCESTLAELATELRLGELLRLGKGEFKSGGQRKRRLLACTLEACLGAVFTDGGLPAAQHSIGLLFAQRLLNTEPGQRDHKSRLQRRAQAECHEAPLYTLLHSTGPDHERLFHVELSIAGQVRAQGEGRSKAEAEQQAACRALEAWPSSEA